MKANAQPPARNPWRRWLIDSPLARIVLFALVATGTAAGTYALIAPLHLPAAVVPLVTTAPIVIVYALLVRYIERRRMTELAPRTAVNGLLAGAALGIALMSLVVGIQWLAGAYVVTGFHAHLPWLTLIVVTGIAPAIGEEIVCRGVLFRIIEEGLGTWAALAISALIFGAAHIGNPGATLWSSAAIAIEAGLLFGLIFNLTRSLWVCMGLHAAWNIMQGPVYGVAVSGHAEDGWIAPRVSGPDWLTGGSFGAEASVVALGCCVVVIVALLIIMIRRGSVVPAPWSKARRFPSAPLTV